MLNQYQVILLNQHWNLTFYITFVPSVNIETMLELDIESILNPDIYFIDHHHHWVHSLILFLMNIQKQMLNTAYIEKKRKVETESYKMSTPVISETKLVHLC